MLKKFLTIALVVATSSFAAGWDYFNPKYAGTAQIRTGVSFDHESQSSVPYINTRYVIKENVEISAKTTAGSVDAVGVKVDFQDKAAIAIDFLAEGINIGAQVYKDFSGWSLGSELSVNTNGLCQFGAEVDTYFFGHVQYAGFTFDSEATWSPYAGYVYPTEKVDFGATYFLVMDGSYYLTSGWSFDLTFKF